MHAMSMADLEELIKNELEGAERFLRVEHDICACVTYKESGEGEEDVRIMELAVIELELEVEAGRAPVCRKGDRGFKTRQMLSLFSLLPW